MLVESLVNYSYSNLTRGNGITLSGWNSQSPINIKLSRNRYKTQDNTLYLVSLPVNYQVDDGELRLTPGVFRWQIIEGNEFGYTPYNAYLYTANDFSFAFQPVIPLQISDVKSLTLDILGSGMIGSIKELNLFLFDFTSEDWIRIVDPIWGSNLIDSPASYVSPEGTIWLRIESTPSINYGLQITRADFTLVVVQK